MSDTDFDEMLEMVCDGIEEEKDGIDFYDEYENEYYCDLEVMDIVVNDDMEFANYLNTHLPDEGVDLFCYEVLEDEIDMEKEMKRLHDLLFFHIIRPPTLHKLQAPTHKIAH